MGFNSFAWLSRTIPARSTEGNTGDKHKQSIKCQALRVIILDELSMVSAELFGALQYVIQKAIRVRGTYKKRADGSIRFFGGVNIVMCADFWQLQPVSRTWLCSDPSGVSQGRAYDALAMLCETDCDTIRNCWTLVERMRCKDVRYNNFLQECRFGNITTSTYCFLHGLPTFAPVAGANIAHAVKIS